MPPVLTAPDHPDDLLAPHQLRRLRPGPLAGQLAALGLPLTVEGGETDATLLDLGRVQLLSLRFHGQPVRLTLGRC